MLELCSYETVALGYSAFCGLFSQQDYLNYEYYFDLVSNYLAPICIPMSPRPRPRLLREDTH